MIRSRLPLQRRLMLSVVGAVALTLVVLIGAFNIVLRERLSHDADNALFTRASAELAALHITADGLAAPEIPDAGAPDTQTWVFAGDRLLEQPPSDPATARAAQLLRASARRTEDPPGTHTRLYAVPVVANGRRLGTVVAAISLTPYENSAQTAMIASVLLGALLLAMVALAARILISRSLQPVAHMTAQASAWSEAHADQRFHLGPPRDELTQLAATLDTLLDRVASSLRHEQRFTSELSHELRSPLAAVITEAQHALRHARTVEQHRAGSERILASAQQMSRTLDTLLTAARLEHRPSRTTGDAAEAARAAASGFGVLAARRGISIITEDPQTPVRIGVETNVAERVLAPLVENACQHGASTITIGLQQVPGAVKFTVQDDGPGVPSQYRERIFEPGWRNGSQGQADNHGAGLGLPLARRLARVAGGDVNLEPCGQGARFTARLPAA